LIIGAEELGVGIGTELDDGDGADDGAKLT